MASTRLLENSFANLRTALADVNIIPRRAELEALLLDLLPSGRNDITPPEIKVRADIKAKLDGKEESDMTESDAMRFFWIADRNHDYLLTLDEWVDAFLPSIQQLDKTHWDEEQVKLGKVAQKLRESHTGVTGVTGMMGVVGI